MFQLTGGQIPPSPPYFNGRFTNGLLWVEILGSQLQISPEATNNFGLGGTTSGNTNSLNFLVGAQLPSLPAQLGAFTALPATPSPDALYVLWAGANDYLILPPQLRTTDTQAVVNNLALAANTLIDRGAQNLIVVNLPDLGTTPQERRLPTAAALSALTSSYNANLTTALQNIANRRDVNILPLDVNALFGEVLADPARYGFTNVSDACLGNPNCTNPDQFLFWDGIHPSARTHRLIGEYAAAAIVAPQAIVPQTEIALNIAKRQVPQIDARLSALRGVQPTNQRLGVFLNGDVNFGDRNNELSYDFINTNLTAGIDYRVSNNLALGVAFGYVNSDTDLNDLGDIDVDGYAVSLYSNFVPKACDKTHGILKSRGVRKQNNFYTASVFAAQSPLITVLQRLIQTATNFLRTLTVAT